MINDVLRYLRKQRGLTQSELAEQLNVSQSTVASWENGSRRPDLDFLTILADFYHIPVDTLLGRQPPNTDDAWELRERLRRDPDFRLLFSAADKATPEHIRAAAAMLKALEPQEFSE